MFVSSRLHLCGIVVALFIANSLAPLTQAQSSSNQGTPAESRTGQSSVSTYARDKIETVNLANGNLSLSIPLATIGGRGPASYTVALSYNSKVWTAQHNQENAGTEGTPEFPPNGIPRDLYTAVFDKPEEFEPGLAKLGGGWTIRLAPGIKALTFGIEPSTSTTCSVSSEEPPKCGYNFVLTKMWLSLPDGSQVELRDKATQGTPAIAPLSNGFRQLIDRDRGRVWQSIDGSNVTFVRDAGYPIGQVGGLHFPSGWVFLPDGSRIRLADGAGEKIIDRNGNFLSVGFGGFVDQLGRQTTISFSENTVSITVRGYLGSADRVMTIQLGAIGDNLRAGFQSLPRPFTTGDAFTDALGNYFEHTLQTPHTDLFEHSEGIKHYGSTEGDDIGARTTVTRLTLLDGRSFSFRYNQYGEVAEIVYPGGGLSQIDYVGSPSSICQLNSQMAATFNRSVSQRRTLTDAINVDAAWLYAYGGGFVNGEFVPGTTVEARQGSATGSLLASESHHFLKLGLGSEYRSCLGNLGTGNEKWEHAKEFRTVTQTGSGSTVTIRQWAQRAPLVWVDDGPSGYLQRRGQEQSPNDPRVVWEETTLENGKVKRVEYGYDDFNNITSMKEYGFGTATSPGALMRETVRTFAGGASAPSVNGYCYTNLNPLDVTCGSGLASDVSSIIHQRQVLLSESIKDGAGNQKAHVDYEYDQYTGDSNHALVAPNTGMIMYDGGRFAIFNPGNEPRGNVTRVSRWAAGGSVVSFSRYDKAGQIVWSKDANGNVATVSYNDNFGSGLNPEPGAGMLGPAGATYAMPTLSTNALGHQVKTQYDYSLGAAAGLKDPNGVITRTEYDSLGRPFRTTAALGLAEQAIAEMSYPTVIGNEARVSKQLDATRWLTTRTSFDGFDRAVISANSEDGLHYQTAAFSIFTRTIYDAMGRVKRISNPSRNTTATTDGWTRYSYDLIGRPTEVATFAGGSDSPPPESGTNSSATGVVTTVYAGEVTTVTDQAGRKRRSATDALGRVKEVYEAPDDPAFNHLTSYDYDVLDNLVKVTQGSQNRYFMYDSLKRLQRVRVPEQNINSSLALLDPVTGNSQWSIAYVYDSNGNLIEKTDARGVVVSYTYDPLNRNRTVDYSDTGAIIPDLTRRYDGAAGGVGRLSESFAGGSEFVGANVDHTRIVKYDASGRPQEQQQRFKTNGVWSAEYRTQREYNVAGAVTLQIYPSGHAVSNAFDNAGRPSTFTGNLGDGANRIYSTGMLYAATGGLTKEQFGTETPVFNKLYYNSRGQLAEIRASTSYSGPNDTTWNRGAILNQFSLQCSGVGCNATDNNGNVRRQETLVPQNDQVSSYQAWAQVYDYDPLNRLSRVKEYDSNNSQLWQQEYAYDRWGNRLINNQASATWGLGTSQTQTAIDTSTNRIYAINDPSHSLVDYDAAGNQTRDYLTSNGTRAYDAENRITSVTAGVTNATYTYNSDSQRVRRKVNGVETWQVYGIDGELLAEYEQNGSPMTPRKEYGYRNGQLLVSAEPGSGSVAPVFGDDFNDNSLDGFKWSQVAPGAPPTVMEQAQQLQINLAPNASGYNGIYSASTHSFTGRMVQVEVSQAVSQAGWCENLLELELNAQNYFLMDAGSGNLLMRARVNGVNDQTVLGYNAAAHRHWRIRHNQSANTISFETSPDGAVWTIRKTVTPGFALSALRFHLVAGAWGTGNANPGAAKYDNFKLLDAAAGSSSLAVANAGFESPAVGLGNFQYGPSGGSWIFAGGTGVSASGSGFTSAGTAPEGNQIAFIQGGTTSVISQAVSGFQSATNYSISFLSKQRTNCCNAGGQDIAVYLDNNLLGSFHPATNGFVDYSTPTFTTTAGSHTIKFVGLNPLGGDHTAFIDSVRILGSPVPGAGVEWLITDHLGTPRMVIDQSGALGNVKRHDYLPFGEELVAGQGGRTAALGYTGDGVRQKFTQKERDAETGLDYFGARYYSSAQGRFTSPDEFWKDSQIGDPQSWNKYAYVRNNPLRYVDPTGEKATVRIQTDEKNKRGTITVTASIAIFTKDKNISQEALAKASGDIKSSIEKSWKGQYEQNGIKFDVSVEVNVTVAGSESEANGSGAQNVIELTDGPADSSHKADSVVPLHPLLGGADSGKWNINNLARDAGHEFGHLMGSGDHEGKVFMNTSAILSAARATAYDYGWVFGGAINSHRSESRPNVISGSELDARSSRGFGRGQPTSHTSTREIRPGRLWWR